MRCSIVVAATAILAAAIPAAADTIASPPIFGGLTQTKARCGVYNLGQSPLPVAFIDFWRDDGVLVSHTSPCGTTAAPNLVQPATTCEQSILIAKDRAYSCRVTLVGKANARGAIEVKNSGNLALNRADLW